MPPAVFNAIVAPMSRPTRPAPDVKRETAGNAAPSMGRRHQENRDRGHSEARGYLHGLAARRAHGPHAGRGLRVGEPDAQQRDDKNRGRACAGNEETEGPPWIVNGTCPSDEQKTTERETTEVRGQHHREGVASRAQELHQQLGPDYFVAERHAAGRGVERKRKSCFARICLGPACKTSFMPVGRTTASRRRLLAVSAEREARTP